MYEAIYELHNETIFSLHICQVGTLNVTYRNQHLNHKVFQTFSGISAAFHIEIQFVQSQSTHFLQKSSQNVISEQLTFMERK